MRIFQSIFTVRQLTRSQLPLVALVLFLQSCSQMPQQQKTISHTNRADFVANLQQWKVTGQIAFMQEKKREKASLHWVKKADEQSLTLTTYLGIKVLSLDSTGGQHALEVDGETYQTDDLDRLIWQLTGLLLPSEALAYWIKAMPFSKSDKVIYHNDRPLPKALTSNYNNLKWHVQYQKYQTFSGVDMPTALTVKQNGLTIKLAIKHWTI